MNAARSSDGPRPARAARRIAAQRERILCAAETCFVRSGFYAASMATIAETAGMSPGLIYRYFESKNAIILAIIEQQLEVARRRIRALRVSDDLAERIIEHFDEQGAAGPMSRALYLEISAQATRDPQIAEALRRFDIAVCAEVADWLGRSPEEGGYGLPDDARAARALMLLCLIEGLELRSAREPALDRRLLKQALAEIIAPLVGASACKPGA